VESRPTVLEILQTHIENVVLLCSLRVHTPTVNHETFRLLVNSSRYSVGVDPATARAFFTDPNAADMRALVGEGIGREKLCIFLMLIGALASLVIGFWSAYVVFKWWSILVIPVSGLTWVLHKGWASMGTPRLWPFLIALIIVWSWEPGSEPHSIKTWISWNLSAMLFIRLMYRSASFFFRSLILRNAKAYLLYRESAVMVKEQT
jgi:hypothetical protein